MLNLHMSYFYTSTWLDDLAMAFEHRLSHKRNQAREMDEMILKRNKMNNFIRLVSLSLHSLDGGYIYIYVRRLFIERKCPLSYYKFGKYSRSYGLVRHLEYSPASDSAGMLYVVVQPTEAVSHAKTAGSSFGKTCRNRQPNC